MPRRVVTHSKKTAASLSHVNERGEARMVDVGEKPSTHRTAVAEAYVLLSPPAMRALRRQKVKKGDVIGTARIAGISAAKRTHELIPLCHPLRIDAVEVTIAPVDAADVPPDIKRLSKTHWETLRVETRVSAFDRTGVEMEALTACGIAALTIYDMLKAVDKGILIACIRLLQKSGGKSGDYLA